MRVTCPHCGTEQRAPATGSRCVVCERDLFPPTPPRSTKPIETAAEAAPTGKNAALLGEISATDKWLTGVVTLVPLLGPSLVSRSQHHSKEEKRRLVLIAIVASVVEILALGLFIATRPSPHTELHTQVAKQTAAIGKILEEYARKNGRFPDVDTWEQMVRDSPATFTDPWERRYRYEKTDGGVAVGTFGKAHEPGGIDADSDVWKSFDLPL